MFVNPTRQSRCWLRLNRGCAVAGLALLAIVIPVLAEEPAPTEQPKSAPKDSPEDAPSEAAHTRVRLETSKGEIVLELFDDKSPVTVANFVQYVRDGFYDGLVFHRVIPGFVLQSGGHTPDLELRTEGLRPPIKNESGNLLKNERGTIAMARLSDPHSATSQFFINLVDNPSLNRTRREPYGYAVFGKVVEGMDVVDRIASAPCTQHPNDPRKGEDGPVNPDPPIVIERALVIEAEPAGQPEPKREPPSDENKKSKSRR